ncbi:hypothetical protein [Bacillus sp. CGMCC 1.16541]|uniref:hypothetical protein n=1 Tax=Bacillus sp. CGMCC 1.16541 TaxID=2185143 RepID=UPI0013A5524D|nr:hypothetical protein [Bacillus sp. CGMCC 1.16541]
MKHEKPVYFDGSGIGKKEVKSSSSTKSKQVVITEDMRKQLSGNPYVAKSF